MSGHMGHRTGVALGLAALVVGVCTALSGPASAASSEVGSVGFGPGGTLAFTGWGDHADDLRITSKAGDDPDSPSADRIAWTFADNAPLRALGRACSHPLPRHPDIVTCYRTYGTSGVEPGTDVRLVVHLGGGSDRLLVTANDDHDNYYAGGKGNDVITAGLRDDHIYGNSGNDTIRAGKGDDYLSGGAGDDVLYGNSGNDHLRGGGGADRLAGGPGRNVLQP